jgi:hypothetical protein
MNIVINKKEVDDYKYHDRGPIEDRYCEWAVFVDGSELVESELIELESRLAYGIF